MPFTELRNVALLVAVGGTMVSASRAGLRTSSAYWAGLIGVVVGLAAGGALVMATRSGSFWEVGTSAYGFLFGAAVGGSVYLRLRRLAVLAYADAAAPAIALAYAVARLGCFANGDDFGRLSTSPWAVTFSPGTEAFAAHLARGWVRASSPASLPVEPVQLYAAALGVVLFLLIVTVKRRPGVPVFIAALGYGLGRFVLEWLRDDYRPWLVGLSLPQVLSVILALVGVAVLVRIRFPARHVPMDYAPQSVSGP